MRRCPAWSTLLLACLFILGSSSPSYHSILSKKRIKEFYASGGKSHLNKRVHIHVNSSVFKKKARRVRLPGGKTALRFDNRSVPILVNPWNRYYKRLQRKKEVKGLLCIKGHVYRPDWDLKGRCFLRVHAIKTYGGKLAGYE